MNKASVEWEQTVVQTAKGVEGFDVSPDGKEIWAVAAENGSIYIIDTATKAVVKTLDAKAVGANRLKITYDGKLALISSLRTGELVIYDVKARRELKRLKVENGCCRSFGRRGQHPRFCRLFTRQLCSGSRT